MVVGTDRDRKTGALRALLAHNDGSGLNYAGAAFIALSGIEREEFLAEIERLTTSWAAIKSSRQSDAKWCQPRLTVRVKHLAGVKTLRHGVSAIARRLRSAALLSSAMGNRPLSEDATRPTKVEQFIFFYWLMLRPVVAVSFTPILRSSDAFGQRDFATPFGLRASATPAHLRICWLRPVVHIR